ncbi:MAG: glycosyltransferase family 39 protein [bacterium]|nr:glycosyltransferase family 39 protein [bacterium]
MSNDKPNKLDYFAIIMLMLAGATIRLILASKNSLWLDEQTSLFIASGSFGDIISGKGFDSHTPPFYYLVLHLWLRALAPLATSPLFDNAPLFIGSLPTELGLRLLSVLIDTANIALVFLCADRIANKRISRLTTILYACSSYAIYFAAEARMYPLLALQCLITLYIALEARKQLPGPWKLILLLLVGITGMYTHYYYALFLAALSIGLMLDARFARQLFWRWSGTLFIIAVAFLPWLKVVTTLIGSGGQSFRKFLFSVPPYTLFRYSAGYGVFPLRWEDKYNLSVSFTNHATEILLFVIPFSILSLAGIYRILRYSHYRYTILSCLLLPGLIALAISSKIPMLSERYLIVSFPLFLLGVATGTEQTRTFLTKGFLSKGAVIALSLIATSMNFINPLAGFTQWREATTMLASRADLTKDKVIVEPEHARGVVLYYLERDHNLILPRKNDSKTNLNSSTYWLIERLSSTATDKPPVVNGRSAEQSFTFPKENGLRLSRYEQQGRSGNNGLILR